VKPPISDEEYDDLPRWSRVALSCWCARRALRSVAPHLKKLPPARLAAMKRDAAAAERALATRRYAGPAVSYPDRTGVADRLSERHGFRIARALLEAVEACFHAREAAYEATQEDTDDMSNDSSTSAADAVSSLLMTARTPRQARELRRAVRKRFEKLRAEAGLA
jgi:hypothetical protein